MKQAMPHIKIKDKGFADLYFEFLEPKDRKVFFEDLKSKEKPIIKLPNFGKVDKYEILNNQVKEFSIKDLTKDSEKFIEHFIETEKKPPHPFLEYNKQIHEFELKPKYDIENMLNEIVINK